MLVSSPFLETPTTLGRLLSYIVYRCREDAVASECALKTAASPHKRAADRGHGVDGPAIRGVHTGRAALHLHRERIREAVGARRTLRIRGARPTRHPAAGLTLVGSVADAAHRAIGVLSTPRQTRLAAQVAVPTHGAVGVLRAGIDFFWVDETFLIHFAIRVFFFARTFFRERKKNQNWV